MGPDLGGSGMGLVVRGVRIRRERDREAQAGCTPCRGIDAEFAGIPCHHHAVDAMLPQQQGRAVARHARLAIFAQQRGQCCVFQRNLPGPP